MINTEKQQSKRLHFGLLLLISFTLFNVGYVVDETIRWTNPFQGFQNGIFHIILFGFLWCIYLLPWSILVYVLYRWRKWKKFRTHWVLAPAVFILLFTLLSLVFHPQTPFTRFKQFAKTELPSNSRNLHYYFIGGGLSDYGDTYYFETTPEEINRLIVDMQLKISEDYDDDLPVSSLPGCPDISTWKNIEVYHLNDDLWYYDMITEQNRTQAYISIYCI